MSGAIRSCSSRSASTTFLKQQRYAFYMTRSGDRAAPSGRKDGTSFDEFRPGITGFAISKVSAPVRPQDAERLAGSIPSPTGFSVRLLPWP